MLCFVKSEQKRTTKHGRPKNPLFAEPNPKITVHQHPSTLILQLVQFRATQHNTIFTQPTFALLIKCMPGKQREREGERMVPFNGICYNQSRNSRYIVLIELTRSPSASHWGRINQSFGGC